MNLIIVESPTKAKTLMRFLGKEYSVEATMGHIKDLPKSELGVDVEKNFAPSYLLVPKRGQTVVALREASKKAKKIYLATDPDREGEAIASHVAEVLKDKKNGSAQDKLERIVFHEITKEAVEEALGHSRKIDRNLVDAQVARRVLDRLVGYKLSPLLWRKVRRGLSAGRVQSVAVRLIVEKEREIEKFKADEYWEIWSDVVSQKKKGFRVMLVRIGEKKADVNNKEDAQRVVSELKKAAHEVSEVKKREVRRNPYPPFTTSTMTQAGARVFGWSAKKTMQVAQRLYEEGLITYHRTDSTNIAGSAVSRVRSFIEKEYGKTYIPESPRFYKTQSKVAQEAHEAVRPTDVSMASVGSKASKAGGDGSRLYELIWRRFVACQMVPAVYDETVIDVAAAKYMLRASGQTVKFDGWRKVLPGKLTEEAAVSIPEVERGEKLSLKSVGSEQKFTQPPARFNEASLIKTLEKLGIGRPSTYAPIITTIKYRNYVEKKDGKFYPTPVGVAVNDFLVGNFPDIVDYSFTASMEDDLDKVADGKKEWTGTLKSFWNPFTKKLDSVGKKAKRVKIETEKLGRKCPTCKEGELVVRIGRFGKFISCSRFPECKHTEKYTEKLGMKCPKCKKGDVVVKRTGKGRSFFGCSRYPECDWASWRDPRVKKGVDKAVSV